MQPPSGTNKPIQAMNNKPNHDPDALADAMGREIIEEESALIREAAAMMGRKGGRARTEAKARASRENGRKGGKAPVSPDRALWAACMGNMGMAASWRAQAEAAINQGQDQNAFVSKAHPSSRRRAIAAYRLVMSELQAEPDANTGRMEHDDCGDN